MQDKVRYVKAKIRNLLYYWDNDPRPRKNYSLVLRTIRKQLLEIVEKVEDEYLKKILEVIDPKVNSKSQGEVIEKMKGI